MSHIAIVDSRSLRDQVQGALEAALVAGELVPGELYSAPILGERFGVSATPVREAMLSLVNDGLVIAERNRGFRIVEISETDLDEICQIRLMLEVPATVEVAKSIAPEALDRLEKISDEIVAAAASGDLIEYLDADRRFHAEIIAELGNGRLEELIGRLRRQTRLLGLDALVPSGRLAASAEEHHKIVGAMRTRNLVELRRLMTSHIKHVRGLWVGRDEA
jgi:DNA-binding GntR family transcriptional regulator